MVTMGYRYDSSAVLDAVVEVPSTEDVAASLDGAPGSRIPHRWVNGTEVSTVDLPESGFALLTGPMGDNWAATAREADVARWMGLRVVRLSRPDAIAVRLYESDAILVRPDGFIAWRTSGTADAALLKKVLLSVTGRQA